MFSFQISPIELGGFPASGKDMEAISPGLGEEMGGFSEIMSDFKGDHDFQQLNAKLVKLAEFGLPADQLHMLKQLVADGKTLPEAAEAVFGVLQEQLAGLLENGQIKFQDLEQIQKQMAILAKILPDEVKEQLKPLLKDLELALKQVEGIEKQVEVIDKTASQESKITGVASQAEELESEPEQLENNVLPGTVNPVVLDEVSREINSNIKAAKNASQNITPANIHDGKAFRGPVEFQENYGQLKDQDLKLDLSKAAADNKIILNPANKLASARINTAMLSEQLSIPSQSSAGIGGERSFGTMLNNGQNTSFTQLMSQSIPQPITQNIHKPEWGGAVGDRITWMLGNKLQSAQLRITPAHLGPVEIRISIENNVAQVSFTSNHQVVRDALEQAVPRLKEMLEEQNLDLVNVDIGKGNNRETDEQSKQLADAENRSAAELVAENDETADQVPEISKVITGAGLLDAYA